MRDILVTVKEWIIRYFNSKSRRYDTYQDEIFWYRTQLSLRDHEIKSLIEKINSVPAVSIPEPVEVDEKKQEHIGGRLPWPQHRAALERADREKYNLYRKEKAIQDESARPKTTEELEDELLKDGTN